MQFNFRGDIIDEATAIKKGVVKRDEYNHLWMRIDFNNEPIILDANVEINKDSENKEQEIVKEEIAKENTCKAIQNNDTSESQKQE